MYVHLICQPNLKTQAEKNVIRNAKKTTENVDMKCSYEIVIGQRYEDLTEDWPPCIRCC